MTPYNTLEYMLKGTDLINKINTEPFEIRLRDLYEKCGDIPDTVLRAVIDETITEKKIWEAMDTYEHFDTIIDEYSLIMDELRNL